jgi:hypothetical protein
MAERWIQSLGLLKNTFVQIETDLSVRLMTRFLHHPLSLLQETPILF